MITECVFLGELFLFGELVNAIKDMFKYSYGSVMSARSNLGLQAL